MQADGREDRDHTLRFDRFLHVLAFASLGTGGLGMRRLRIGVGRPSIFHRVPFYFPARKGGRRRREGGGVAVTPIFRPFISPLRYLPPQTFFFFFFLRCPSCG